MMPGTKNFNILQTVITWQTHELVQRERHVILGLEVSVEKCAALLEGLYIM
jgi:hypothetical protein